MPSLQRILFSEKCAMIWKCVCSKLHFFSSTSAFSVRVPHLTLCHFFFHRYSSIRMFVACGFPLPLADSQQLWQEYWHVTHICQTWFCRLTYHFSGRMECVWNAFSLSTPYDESHIIGYRGCFFSICSMFFFSIEIDDRQKITIFICKIWASIKCLGKKIVPTSQYACI